MSISLRHSCTDAAHTVNFHQLLVVRSSDITLLVLVVEIVVGIDILFLFDVRVFGLANKVTEPVAKGQSCVYLYRQRLSALIVKVVHGGICSEIGRQWTRQKLELRCDSRRETSVSNKIVTKGRRESSFRPPCFTALCCQPGSYLDDQSGSVRSCHLC
jgi:hypothetical protein